MMKSRLSRMRENEEKQRVRNIVYRQTIKGRFARYKSGAKSRGLIFDLTLEQFKTFWQLPCSYCGDEIKTIGLDRIDSSIGYQVDNIVSCCTVCNWMKMSQSADEFINRCKRIISNS